MAYANFIKGTIDKNKVEQNILNTFYPEAEGGEPIRDLNQLLKPTMQDISESIKNLTQFNNRKKDPTPEHQRLLFEISRRIKKL